MTILPGQETINVLIKLHITYLPCREVFPILPPALNSLIKFSSATN